MGLVFWSDRLFYEDEMNYKQYHCALPLTNITSITDDMIENAFDRVNLMDSGGDSYEDILLGTSLPLRF